MLNVFLKQVLRPLEDKDAQIGFLIIRYLLLQHQEFKSRVKKFVADVNFI